eukprot:CAMPEP_0184498496 /NCGR_PEP_ID=MMETSP0113_2-20130426/39153_1 /TAXON_ID=91329 /ORGANISM="Norrisiella sphaerica, Strain BC52" /LENGTH=30 /DNA_ID= /DNA_START= /DNA_END= /DNA_ORIENTATION=
MVLETWDQWLQTNARTRAEGDGGEKDNFGC